MEEWAWEWPLTLNWTDVALHCDCTQKKPHTIWSGLTSVSVGRPVSQSGPTINQMDFFFVFFLFRFKLSSLSVSFFPRRAYVYIWRHVSPLCSAFTRLGCLRKLHTKEHDTRLNEKQVACWREQCSHSVLCGLLVGLGVNCLWKWVQNGKMGNGSKKGKKLRKTVMLTAKKLQGKKY